VITFRRGFVGEIQRRFAPRAGELVKRAG
jgi:hypothetical protein